MAEVTNRINLTKQDYGGLPSTLCKGCGHDSITTSIIASYYELGIPPHEVAKMSGIGCSSKTPAYFLNRAHGFNAVHGRMPSVATGAKLANQKIRVIGVSGDGDSANIGISQLVHSLRRNTDLVYIIENNGTYGLTKGQFSATASFHVPDHYGELNEFQPMDLCQMGIELGATFVARSFSGDRQQMSTLIKAAICHRGYALLDVISPCVTFNDHEGSDKSYAYMKTHDLPLQELGFVPSFEEITVEYKPGESKEVTLHDGSRLVLKKLHEDYDPTDKIRALSAIEKSIHENQVVTGLIYYKKDTPTLNDTLKMTDIPLKDLTEKDLRPSRTAFDEYIHQLK